MFRFGNDGPFGTGDLRYPHLFWIESPHTGMTPWRLNPTDGCRDMNAPSKPVREAWTSVARHTAAIVDAHPVSARAIGAAVPVAIATPVAILLQGWKDGDSFDVMILAVVFATWFGGIRSGLLATLFAAFSLDFFIIGPRYHFNDGLDWIDTVTFVTVALMIGTLYSSARWARQKAETLMRSEAVAHADLERTAQELRAANEIKDEFLGLVSHELKTPLTTIVLDAGILRSRGDQFDAESRTMMAAEIAEEGQRLARIIDNLLVLARGGEVATEPVLLGRLVKRVITRHEALHPDRGIAVDIDPSVVVTAQPLHVEQVVLNLLSNAEKYSPPRMPIRVSVRSYGGEAQVSVSDHGHGIDDKEADLIFSAFYRSASTSGDQPGIGVGLAVCKRLVEAQSGRIWVSRTNDGGAQFSFTLPLDEEANTPAFA